MTRIIPTIISVEEAINNGYKWSKTNNDCEFKGYIPGYLCGFCIEVEKDGKIDYCSMVATDDFDEILIPDYFDSTWNDLGISADLAITNGWTPTGNIVFRGYYTSYYDWEEREDFIKDASEEVINLFNKYCCN